MTRIATSSGLTAIAAIAAVGGVMAVASPAEAGSTDLLKQALVDNATPYLDMRYRFENVDQDGFAKDANASTLRTKLGYKTGELYNLSVGLEVENVTLVGDDNYNDTINGKTHLPTVADPASTEINHAYVTFTGVPNTVVRVGRQPHNLDNERFIGTVGWRQNDQSYDSAAIINSSIPDTTLVYSFVENVNRVFSDDHPYGNLGTSTHVINLSYAGIPYGKLTGYGYLIDLDDAVLAALDSKTFGIRFTGDADIQDNVGLLYTAEYAVQSDYAENPVDYQAAYWTAEGGVRVSGLTAKIGYESLGSDNGGAVSFQTPLATLHKFNGWADQFQATPAGGLEDLYGEVSYTVSGLNENLGDTRFVVAYHDFSAESGGANYGTEWDGMISQQFMDHYSLALKYADYNADSFSTDIQKFWVVLGAAF